ncbi:hypothetical protein [Microbacterium sp. VKM Ac-2923]|uniref:hypothetical protein n=1 Tax=Microbacterium sp. VKM Ac-2923 TaxID=2929476 RepID=UPI001FB37ABC|nr:hypothetical protein [Microbacterium sp. VKM Ac-2923]MCJ1707059.1 hypothetical protein [Microbacterium sp. VKM Ac-2923]
MTDVSWRATLAGIVLMVPVVLSGCGSVFPVECPAIGWSNTIVVTGPADGVSAVDLCDERGCAAESARRPDLLGIQPPSVDGTVWTFSLPDMSTPDVISVRATGTDGAVLVREGIAVEWTRVGGSEQCGGPGEARMDLEAVLSSTRS